MSEMSRFVSGVLEDLEEECLASMLHDNMDLARLMVYAQQVEESLLRKRGREDKNPRPSEQAGSSTGVLVLVGVRLESRTGPSSRRGTSAQVILLLPGTQIPKWTSFAQKGAMIEMLSVTTSCVVNVDVCMEVSAW